MESTKTRWKGITRASSTAKEITKTNSSTKANPHRAANRVEETGRAENPGRTEQAGRMRDQDRVARVGDLARRELSSRVSQCYSARLVEHQAARGNRPRWRNLLEHRNHRQPSLPRRSRNHLR